MLGGLPLSHTADSEPKQDAPCGALGLRIVFLTPPIWKRLADIPAGKEHKDLARTRAIARWPATQISLPASATSIAARPH